MQCKRPACLPDALTPAEHDGKGGRRQANAGRRGSAGRQLDPSIAIFFIANCDRAYWATGLKDHKMQSDFAKTRHHRLWRRPYQACQAAGVQQPLKPKARTQESGLWAAAEGNRRGMRQCPARPRSTRYCPTCQPPPNDWISATAVVWRSAIACTSARRAFSAVVCAVMTSVKLTWPLR
jgi:hypothetical protein